MIFPRDEEPGRAEAVPAPQVADKKPLDSANHFLVAAQGDQILLLKPPIGKFSRTEAVNLACWLLSLADPDAEEFGRVLREIKRT